MLGMIFVALLSSKNPGVGGCTIQRDPDGRIHRSKSATAAFQRQHPCPSTHRPTGACPGYVIDHIVPLACGGCDIPANMQWQTIADAKAKDKIERRECGGQ